MNMVEWILCSDMVPNEDVIAWADFNRCEIINRCRSYYDN